MEPPKNKDPIHVILREERLLNGMTRHRKPERRSDKKAGDPGKGETIMKKLSWKETMIEIAGTMKTDAAGEIVFTAKQFKDKTKFTATLVVADKSPLSVLARKNVWIFIDGLRKEDVDALNELKDQGKIDASTRWIASGHLVRTPGKPGMNDILNLKVTSMRLAGKDEAPFVDFEEALSKEEWQVLKNERFNKALAEAPVAPSAPVAPF